MAERNQLISVLMASSYEVKLNDFQLVYSINFLSQTTGCITIKLCL